MIDRRNLLGNMISAGAAAALLGPGQLLAQEAADPYLRHVHPQLRAFAAEILKLDEGQFRLDRANLAEARSGSYARMRPFLSEIPVAKRIIRGPKDNPEIVVYVVNERAGETRPAILHTHGGGYVTGSAESDVANLQTICQELDCMAVSVDYRLAPETTWEGSVEDNYAALKWLHANAEALGADAARIALLGESAGGGHAALLALAARDRGEIPVCFQCLVYPMLDDRTGSTRSVPDHVGKIIWTKERNRFGWESFLGMPPGGANVPVAAVPARVENLAGLPPTFIGVGTIDLFVDEDIEYAQRLSAAGVPVELIVVPGAFHGFDSHFIDAPISRWFNQAKLDALRQGLAGTA